MTKLALDTYPGTLNLEITEAEDLRAFEILKAGKGVEIIPEEPAFCSAQCYPVLISGLVRGAIVLPCVADYPKNKMELIAAVHIRETLHLKGGDIVEVEIL